MVYRKSFSALRVKKVEIIISSSIEREGIALQSRQKPLISRVINMSLQLWPGNLYFNLVKTSRCHFVGIGLLITVCSLCM